VSEDHRPTAYPGKMYQANDQRAGRSPSYGLFCEDVPGEPCRCRKITALPPILGRCTRQMINVPEDHLPMACSAKMYQVNRAGAGRSPSYGLSWEDVPGK